MKQKIRRIINSRTVNGFIFISFALSAAFVIILLVYAPSIESVAGGFGRVKSDYVLMLVQCVLGMFAMLLPGIFQKRLRVSIPSKMLLFYALFLYCAIYLGEVRAFYYNIPHWDTILHTFSGVLLGTLGFSLITLLNKTDTIPIHLSPAFVALFTLCFGVTLGVVWEFYEFFVDGMLQTNMQKYMLEGGEALIGREALVDTMKDLIVDFIGAVFISVVGYISLKYEKGWLDKLTVKFTHHG